MSAKKSADEKIGSVPPFGLRLLPELKQRLEEAAAAEGHSLNREITRRLEESFSPTDALSEQIDRQARQLEQVMRQMQMIADAFDKMAKAPPGEGMLATVQASIGRMDADNKRAARSAERGKSIGEIIDDIDDLAHAGPAARSRKAAKLLKRLGDADDHIAKMEEQGKVKRLRSEYLSDEEKAATPAKRKIRSDPV